MDARVVTELVPVESSAQLSAARALDAEYLRWVASVAKSKYGLEFDVEAMVHSDFEDRSKFFPPAGRFYLARWRGEDVGIGCLKQLAPGMGEIQRMYVQPRARGSGLGRQIVERLMRDAASLGYRGLRLESLKALHVAHALYRSVGFVDIDPYAENSMRDYHAPEALDAYRRSVVFMEWNAV